MPEGGRRNQKGPAAHSPVREKRKPSSKSAHETSKKKQFRNTVVMFDADLDDGDSHLTRQSSQLIGGMNIGTQRETQPEKRNAIETSRKDYVGVEKAGETDHDRESEGDQQRVVLHTVHWLTLFEKQIVYENLSLYRHTTNFNFGKWHREQGKKATSAAKSRHRTCFSGPIFAIIKCTDKTVKQQCKLESPEEWDKIMKIVQYWEAELRRKGLLVDILWVWTKKEQRDLSSGSSSDGEESKEPRKGKKSRIIYNIRIYLLKLT